MFFSSSFSFYIFIACKSITKTQNIPVTTSTIMNNGKIICSNSRNRSSGRSSIQCSRLSADLCMKIAHNWQIILIIGIFMHAIDVCNGHGRLIEPPSRSSAFRYGFQTPPNYNDHELYCGGFQRQQKNGGKCGECGDAYG